MVSVNRSASNAAALASLRQINSQLQTAQDRIATGYKVASAKDDASVWVAATKIRSEITFNKAITAGFAEAQSAAEVASAGVDVVSSALSDISTLVSAMKAAGSASTDQKTQLAALQAKITAAANGANSGTVNLLTAAGNTVTNIGFKSDGTTAITATYTAAVLTTQTNVATTIAANPTLTAASDINTYATAVAAAQKEVAAIAGNLANYTNTLQASEDFLNKINTIRETALSKMVDADMEEESARVNALQVKQQLAYQALSIGNSSVQNILRLFQ